MNPADADPLLPEAAPADDGAEGAADKPKRRRAPRKTAAVDEGAAPAAAADFVAPSAEELFAKPRRAPRRKPAAADEGAAADAAPADAQRAPETTASAAPASDAPAANADEAGAPGEASSAGAPGADGGEDRPRRGRNRRRGRRGGERERGADVAADGNEAGPAQPQRPTGAAAEEVFAEVLSGAYDAEPVAELDAPAAEAPAETDAPIAAEASVEPADVAVTAPEGTSPESNEPAKRVLAPEPDAPKLHKVLAQAGVGSRRDLEQMITDNRVTVNGAVAHTGQRISFGDRIQIDGKPVRYRIAPPPARVLAYHKPAGEVVTHDDPQQRPTVFRRLPRLQQGKWQSVGRLDINTEGLLLFTTSGELANQLMHPRFGVEREYAVRSLGVLGQEAKARLLEGVEIDGQRCAFKSIEDGGGEGVNHWYRCVITEGRNREVRKLFETVGHAVSRLIRIRYGSVVLPRGLKRGVWVDLDDHDLRNLRRLAGGPGADRPDRPERAGGEAAGDGGRNKNRRDRRGKRRNDDNVVRAERPPRPERQDRPARPERQERPPRNDRGPRPPRAERSEAADGGAIPNPLQQTFDKRALQRDKAPRRELSEDGPIPNPLQQTYDKRFASGAAVQRGPAALGVGQGKRGRGDAKGGRGGPKAGGAQQGDPTHIPDPMKTSLGYIGGDAFHRKAGGGGGGGGRGGPRRNSGGGGGGGGRGGRGGGGGRGPGR